MDFYCEQVLSGKTAVEVVAETDGVLAFHHTQPYWPVHVVVIPKRHIASLAALEEGEMATVREMMDVAAEICRKLTKEHGGCRLSTNCGDHQTTKHLHFYIHSGERIRDVHGNPLT
ncbi:HIT domain-containing protein [Luteolibacter sp. Populi]|uniref:HIT domain-containing protein n=1 Tax=Luteolibacter sp. Populi TaxID=3230487 RepID=UPI003465684B